ncbi:MAG TPA: peptidylprolyl isomerase, partial [Rubrivivax sp.]|nr:peptidylprolyl isomerase [Rubrivivax sp.]
IETVAARGCGVFIVHARKAWLKGLSPKENREVPPLNYQRVYQLKRDFPALAAELSNCPSGADGGALGWLTREDCASEFAREIFAGPEIGVLPRLVHSRFGLHVVQVLAREAGRTPLFETVRGAVALALRQHSFVSALRQYLQLLAGQAKVEGVVLDSADTPLVQ